ncbi:MAG: aldo/keto reductase [Methanoregula sp.]
MLYRTIKNVKMRIPAIGQGTMGIGGHFSKDTTRDEKWIEQLRLGVDLGMNFIDTAEIYGAGHSEEIVGKAIHGIRDDVFIATKVSPEHCTYNSVLESAEQSLKRLNCEWIDLYQIHWPNPDIPLGETLSAMENLVDEGKVRCIGLSNFSVGEMKKAQSALSQTSICSMQNEYNLVDRSAENEIIPYCRDHNVILIAWSPLLTGKIAPTDKRMETLREISSKYDMTLAQLVLNWLTRDPYVMAIVKSSNEIHLRENSTALDQKISESDYCNISKIFQPVFVEIPADEIEVTDTLNRNVYKTKKEAIENKYNFVPSPQELAEQIKNGVKLKPIKVRLQHEGKSPKKYDLIEGRVRYWAWVIAYGETAIISVLVDSV